jgi:hypothetical protein
MSFGFVGIRLLALKSALPFSQYFPKQLLLNIIIQIAFLVKYLILKVDLYKNLFRLRNIKCERNRAFVIIGYFGQEKQVQSV